MSNENKPLLNYFAVNEVLTAAKLNQALDILNTNINALRSTISQFVTDDDVDNKINNLKDQCVLLSSPNSQIINSAIRIDNKLAVERLAANALLSGVDIATDLSNPANLFSSQITKIENGTIHTSTLIGTNNGTDALSANIKVQSPLLFENVSAYEGDLIAANKFQTYDEVVERIKAMKAIKQWNSAYEYQTGDTVMDGDKFYVSLVDANMGNVPVDNPTKWKPYYLDFDNYYDKTHIDSTFIPIDALTKYNEGRYHRPTNITQIAPDQVITLPFKFAYNKSNLIVTIGGVVQTLNIDYIEVPPTDGTDNTQQVQFKKAIDLSLTGALEFRCLPYGQVVAEFGIDDDAPSKLSSYSSAKLEEMYRKLVRYVNANTALANSEWALTKQVSFANLPSFKTTKGWIPLARLGLKWTDIFPNDAEVIKVKPARRIRIFVNGGCYEGYIQDATQEQVVLTSTTQYNETSQVLINRLTEKFFVQSDGEVYFYQFVVHRSRLMSMGLDPDAPDADAFDNVIDDNNILVDKTWSSLKIKQSLDEQLTHISDLYNHTTVQQNKLATQIGELKTYVDGADATTLQSANQYTDTQINQSKTEIADEVFNRVNNQFVADDELTAIITPIQTELNNKVDLTNNQTINGNKTFTGTTALNIATINHTASRPEHITNKAYVDNSITTSKGEVINELNTTKDTLQAQITQNTNNTQQIIDDLRRANLLSFEGTYNSDTTYQKNDVVVNQSTWYVSLINDNTQPLTEPTAWETITTPINIDLNDYALKTEVTNQLTTKVNVTDFDTYKQNIQTQLQQNQTSLNSKVNVDDYNADKLTFAKLNEVNNFTQQINVEGDVVVGSTTRANKLLKVFGKIKATQTDEADNEAVVNVGLLKQYSLNANNDNNFTGTNSFANNITLNATPTDDLHIINKKFADTNYVSMSADQTINGNKTFVAPLSIATPTTDTHATTKAYVDSSIANNQTNITDRLNELQTNLDNKVDTSTYDTEKAKFARTDIQTTFNADVVFGQKAVVNDPVNPRNPVNKQYFETNLTSSINTAKQELTNQIQTNSTNLTQRIEQVNSSLNTVIDELRNVRIFTVVGQHDPSRTYKKNEAVVEGKKMYLSLIDNNTQPLTDPDAWFVLEQPVSVDFSNHYTKAETNQLLQQKVDTTTYTQKVDELNQAITTNHTQLTQSVNQLQTNLNNKLDTATYEADKPTFVKTNTANTFTQANTFTGAVSVETPTTGKNPVNLKFFNDKKAEIDNSINQKYTELTDSVATKLDTSIYDNDKTNFALKNATNTFTNKQIINKTDWNDPHALSIEYPANKTGHIVFREGNTVTAHIGRENNSQTQFMISSGDRELKLRGGNNNIYLNRSGLRAVMDVEFGQNIRVGSGGTLIRFTPEDSTTKTLQFYNNAPTDSKRLMLRIAAPTENNHAANKQYVDEKVLEAQTGNNQINTEVATIKQNITALQQKDTTHDTLIAELETTTSQLETSVADISPRLDTTEAKANANETNITALQQTITTKLDTATYTTEKANFALKNAENTFANLNTFTNGLKVGGIRLSPEANNFRFIPYGTNKWIYFGGVNDGEHYFAGLDLNNRVILQGLPTPTEASHAANKAYVDSSITTANANVALKNENNNFTIAQTINTNTTDNIFKITSATNQRKGIEFVSGNAVKAGFWNDGMNRDSKYWLEVRDGDLNVKSTAALYLSSTGGDVNLTTATNRKVNIHGNVEFGQLITFGRGTGTARILPEDNSTKTLRFFDGDNPTAQRRFMLEIPDPTSDLHAVNKRYLANNAVLKATITVNKADVTLTRVNNLNSADANGDFVRWDCNNETVKSFIWNNYSNSSVPKQLSFHFRVTGNNRPYKVCITDFTIVNDGSRLLILRLPAFERAEDLDNFFNKSQITSINIMAI